MRRHGTARAPRACARISPNRAENACGSCVPAFAAPGHCARRAAPERHERPRRSSSQCAGRSAPGAVGSRGSSFREGSTRGWRAVEKRGLRTHAVPGAAWVAAPQRAVLGERRATPCAWGGAPAQPHASALSVTVSRWQGVGQPSTMSAWPGPQTVYSDYAPPPGKVHRFRQPLPRRPLRVETCRGSAADA